MAPLAEAVTTVRRTARTVGFGALTTSMLGVFELHAALLPAQRDALFAEYRSTYLDRVLQLFGVELTLTPGAPPPSKGARLVVANHRSALDIGILLRHFGGQMLSRGDLANWPLIGLIARKAGTLFVDRSEGMKRAGAARTIRRRLSEGATILVFPEGTTFKGDEVRTFQAGVFAAAKGLDVEVIPVGIAYEPGAEYREPTFLKHLGATAGRPRTRVVMNVGAGRPMGSDTRSAASSLQAEVQRLVNEARETYGRVY